MRGREMVQKRGEEERNKRRQCCCLWCQRGGLLDRATILADKQLQQQIGGVDNMKRRRKRKIFGKSCRKNYY